MKKDSNNSNSNTDDLNSSDQLTIDFEIFKRKVAKSVLEYMEAHSDSELIECLEKSSNFLSNILFQMEKVFDNQKQTFEDKEDLFEIGDDLFSINQQASSSTFH